MKIGYNLPACCGAGSMVLNSPLTEDKEEIGKIFSQSVYIEPFDTIVDKLPNDLINFTLLFGQKCYSQNFLISVLKSNKDWEDIVELIKHLGVVSLHETDLSVIFWLDKTDFLESSQKILKPILRDIKSSFTSYYKEGSPIGLFFSATRQELLIKHHPMYKERR